jgi:hypothetical protein
MHTKLWPGKLKGRDDSEDLGVGRKITEQILWKRWEGVDWAHMAQDRSQWQDLMNMVMKMGNFLTRQVTISFSRRTLLHVVS